MIPFGTFPSRRVFSAAVSCLSGSCNSLAIHPLSSKFYSATFSLLNFARPAILEARILPHYEREIEFLDCRLESKGELAMLITKKMLLALTLVGALVGAGIGALVTHSAENTKAANTNYDTTQPANTTANTTDPNYKTVDTSYKAPVDNASQFKTAEEQAAYRQGLADCEATYNNTAARTSRVSYNNGGTRYVRRYSNGRRVYYDYGTQRHGRTFWQKHRDKLTVAMGTGAGAILGGVIGGKKGAGIGALAGAGGSALYTYKLRRRTRRY